jgi:hypothetical protein
MLTPNKNKSKLKNKKIVRKKIRKKLLAFFLLDRKERERE